MPPDPEPLPPELPVPPDPEPDLEPPDPDPDPPLDPWPPDPEPLDPDPLDPEPPEPVPRCPCPARPPSFSSSRWRSGSISSNPPVLPAPLDPEPPVPSLPVPPDPPVPLGFVATAKSSGCNPTSRRHLAEVRLKRTPSHAHSSDHRVENGSGPDLGQSYAAAASVAARIEANSDAFVVA